MSDNSAQNPKGTARRLCRFPGCTNVVKSQGSCQRHGAFAKKCKVEGCEKQAQGTHDGMCKSHWKVANMESNKKEVTTEQPPVPSGDSVYDSILPASIAYKPFITEGNIPKVESPFEANRAFDGYSEPPEGTKLMPLVKFLRDGRLNKELGWHRIAERSARGLPPLPKLKVQLEAWERQLALFESLLLSGGTPFANFKDLAYAWGRERNFHMVLTSTVCERRGEIQRKRRSDIGKTLTEEQKEKIRNGKRPRQDISVANNGPTADGAKKNGSGVASTTPAADGGKKKKADAKKPRASLAPTASTVTI